MFKGSLTFTNKINNVESLFPGLLRTRTSHLPFSIQTSHESLMKKRQISFIKLMYKSIAFTHYAMNILQEVVIGRQLCFLPPRLESLAIHYTPYMYVIVEEARLGTC